MWFQGQVGLHGVASTEAQPFQSEMMLANDRDTVATFYEHDKAKVDAWLRNAAHAVGILRTHVTAAVQQIREQMAQAETRESRLGLQAALNLAEMVFDLPVTDGN